MEDIIGAIACLLIFILPFVAIYNTIEHYRKVECKDRGFLQNGAEYHYNSTTGCHLKINGEWVYVDLKKSTK